MKKYIKKYLVHTKNKQTTKESKTIIKKIILLIIINLHKATD